MHQNHKRTYHLLALKFGKKKQASPCCRCSLLSPYLCSLPLWRAALRSSRSPPPGSGSLHQRNNHILSPCLVAFFRNGKELIIHCLCHEQLRHRRKLYRQGFAAYWRVLCTFHQSEPFSSDWQLLTCRHLHNLEKSIVIKIHFPLRIEPICSLATLANNP